MCGIVGVATVAGRGLSVGEAGVVAMRERLAHRGPDGAGLWWGGHVGLGHRRLAVVGLGEGGAQPMVSGCGRYVLVYNGELYNEGDVWGEVERERGGGGADAKGEGQGTTGIQPLARATRSQGDTAAVLAAIGVWGVGALPKLRGMFALAWYDRERRVLTLARDVMGIKPLVWWRGVVPGGAEEVVFGSEVTAVLAHPHVAARPDLVTVSSYLTTIRTTLGSRTMFEGVRTVMAGEWIEFDLSGERIVERRGRIEGARRVFLRRAGEREAVEAVRGAVEESVRVHLRSEVPWCGLLSGGLDSTIVCGEARRHVAGLRTYAAGAREGGADISPDFEFAKIAAARLGTTHAECVVSRSVFRERWEWMVGRLGMPLSTPNEVAIHEVASCLRAGGNVVALSGEGADELFGGYDQLLGAAARWVSGGGERAGVGEGGVAALDAAAWVPRGAKSGFLRPVVWQAVEEDAGLVETYRDEFAGCVEEAAGDGWRSDERLMQAFLRLQRRVNLVGLLGRLDGATMLAGVEGRVPFADVGVMGVAEGLGMGMKFVGGVDVSPTHQSLRAETGGTRTKIALRRAFEGLVPAEIVGRAKASFPLPFQEWMGDAAGVVGGSGLVESLFEPAAVAVVRNEPRRVWGLAWPVMNLAMWGERWGW